ncbi:unnamed protein product, partial [Effrenium voratum]
PIVQGRRTDRTEGSAMSSQLLLPIAEQTGPASAWKRHLSEATKRSDWLAVLLGPAISVPFATCYAALICGDATMHAYFPIVLQQVMWTQLVGSIIALVIGQFVTTTNLDPLTAILFGQLARKVSRLQGGESQEVVLINMMVLMPLISLCLGMVLYVVGKLKLAMMLRFIPYTVVAGFLAGSGILILQESLSLAGGVELGDLCRQSLAGLTDLAGGSLMGRWLQIFLSIAFSALLEAAREMHIFGTPVVMAGSVGLSLMLEHFSQGALPPRSWFLEFPDPVSWWEPFVRMKDGLHQSYNKTEMADLEFLGSFLVIMTVSWSINTLAVAKLVPLRPGIRRCDEQDEIRTLGLTNVLLGSCGGLCSMQSFKIPMMMKAVRSGPTWPYFNVVVNVVLFLASPRVIVQSVPRFLFAGTVVRLSCDLINEWLLDARRRISAEEWLVLLATAIVVVINVTLGILFGLFCTLAWFAFEYMNVTGIAFESSLRESRSRVERTEQEHALLQQHGGSTLILWLNGYFFFGLACQVIDQVRDKIGERSATLIILDFSAVPAIDASGVCALVELVKELQEDHKARCILSGMARRLKKSLEREAQHQRVREVEMYPDLDKAAEACEEAILKQLPPPAKRRNDFGTRKSISKIDSLNCIAEVADTPFSLERSNEPDGGIWHHLLANELPHLDPDNLSVTILRTLAGEPQEKANGEVIFRLGMQAQQLIVVLDGAVDVTHPALDLRRDSPRPQVNARKDHAIEGVETRARRARAGAVFGAVEYASGLYDRDLQSYMGAHLSCTGTAVGSTEVLVIDFEALWQAESQEPKLSLVLRTWLSRLASAALMASHQDPLSHLHCREMRIRQDALRFAVV